LALTYTPTGQRSLKRGIKMAIYLHPPSRRVNVSDKRREKRNWPNLVSFVGDNMLSVGW